MRKPWILGGILGAILYPLASLTNVYIGLGMCFQPAGRTTCEIVEWMEGHVFFDLKWGTGIVVAALLDALIGFVIGVVLMQGARLLRRR